MHEIKEHIDRLCKGKRILICHHDDLDGYFSCWLFLKYFEMNDIEVEGNLPVNYKHKWYEKKKFPKNTVVIFLDIHCNPLTKYYIHIDHHSNKDEIQIHKNVIVINTKQEVCTTMATWLILFFYHSTNLVFFDNFMGLITNNIDYMVRVVNCYDTGMKDAIEKEYKYIHIFLGQIYKIIKEDMLIPEKYPPYQIPTNIKPSIFEDAILFKIEDEHEPFLDLYKSYFCHWTYNRDWYKGQAIVFHHDQKDKIRLSVRCHKPLKPFLQKYRLELSGHSHSQGGYLEIQKFLDFLIELEIGVEDET